MPIGGQLRLQNMGMPKRHGGFGNLFVKVILDYPKNPNQNYCSLVEQLSDIEKDNSFLQINDFINRNKIC